MKEFLTNYFIDMYYVLHFVSLFFKTKIRAVERKIEDNRLILQFAMNKDFEIFERSDFDKVFERLLTMRKEILMTYLNSCSAYHSALILADGNQSVAFLLLVIAIESLSNKYYSQSKYEERFKRFMVDFLPEDRRFLSHEVRFVDKKLGKEEANTLFRKLLKSVYGRVRSGFVHFGETSPVASMLADRFQLAYIKTYKDGEKFNPSFLWFKRLVEEVLVNFLFSEEVKKHSDLYSLLSERFINRLKGRKAIKKGQLVTPEDVYLQ